MIPITDFIAFISACLILAFTPGNDVLFIASQSFAMGIRGGVFACLGISFGIVFHILALAFGFSELIIHYPFAFHTIKFAGVAYLLYLAFKAFSNKSHTFDLKERDKLKSKNVFFRGTLTNLLNPKVVLFFLAFLPQFVDPKNGDIFSQILLLGGAFLFFGTLVNLIYAILFGTASHKITQNPRLQKILNKLTGIIFVGLALKLLVSESK